MPRFFFHIRNGVEADDQDGAELADWQAAVEHATYAARAILADQLKRDGRLSLHHRIEITDCEGPVATVRFAEVVDIES